MGLKLGLWVEPEMVNQDREGHVMKNRHTAHLFAYSDYGLSDPHLTTWQDSQLYKQHPEWARSHKIFALHLLVSNDVSNDALFLHWLVFHFDGFCCALYRRTCCLWHVYWQLSALESSNYAKVLHHPARMRSEGRSRSPWQCWSVEVDVISTAVQLSTKQKLGHFCHFNTPWAAGFDVVCELFSDIYTCKLVKRCNYESNGSYLNLGESGYCFLERFSVSSLWRFTAPSTSCLKNLEEEPAGSGSYTWRSTGHWTLRVIEFNERGFSRFWCFPGTRSTVFFLICLCWCKRAWKLSVKDTKLNLSSLSTKSGQRLVVAELAEGCTVAQEDLLPFVETSQDYIIDAVSQVTG